MKYYYATQTIKSNQQLKMHIIDLDAQYLQTWLLMDVGC